MKTIHKYVLMLVPLQTVQMPQGAWVFSAQIQRESICIWAMVDTENTKVGRDIEIADTGNQLDASVDRELSFIGTVQLREYVWHIFDLGENDK